MRVAGIDPGTIHTGVGIVDGSPNTEILVFYKTIDANPKDSLPNRLGLIHAELVKIFETWKPEVVAIENIFFYKDFKAAVKIGEARAAAMIAASRCNVPIVEYLPTRVKQSICGNCRAAKTQTEFMIRQILQIREPLSADSADALAVALCHLYMSKFDRLKKEEVSYV